MHAFPDNEETAQLDLIIIEGDVYDHDLYLYSDAEEQFKFCKKYLMALSAKYNIPIIVLEGTPDHDWRQSKSFVVENELLQMGADIRYVDTVEIIYLERLDMHFLCVPDAWRPTTAETWEIVQDTLKRHNLTKVDFCVMHGCFPHQLPELDGKIQMHDSRNYMSITEYYIVIGHIHQSSQYEKIIAPGSIGRLAHRDEGDKGHVRIDIDLLERKDKIRFVKNPFATPYVTIDMRRLDSDEVFKRIEQHIEKYKSYPTLNFRILSHSDDVATLMYRNITKLYPTVKWAHKSADEKKKSQQLVTALVDKRVELKRVSLDRTNIADVICERIALTEPTLAASCHSLLKEIINGIN